ncbi:beta-ketoacyl synthase N-terminal-like domain-containing protein [Cytobacillus pseudoceanisediminis]|uniref:beta-ketoacyl synthase N-terminal-like domain-containing protein n=1 Tax=Cytobacillus pseudoceanisediminis TaxID=3051614 RepID=UPI003C2CB978
MSEIYLTGIGVITPKGIGKGNIFTENKNAQTIDDINTTKLGMKGLNKFSKVSKFACIAVGEAYSDAGLKERISNDPSISTRSGLVIGENLSNLESILALDADVKKYGVKNVNPGLFPNTVLNVVAGYTSIYYGIKGINTTISNSDPSNINSLLYAIDLLNNNQLDRVVVCSIALFVPEVFKKLCNQKLESESVVALILEKEKIGKSPQLKIKHYNGHHTLLINDEEFTFTDFLGLAKKYTEQSRMEFQTGYMP